MYEMRKKRAGIHTADRRPKREAPAANGFWLAEELLALAVLLLAALLVFQSAALSRNAANQTIPKDIQPQICRIYTQ